MDLGHGDARKRMLKLTGTGAVARSAPMICTLRWIFQGVPKFSDFDDLLDVSLPPIGPYRLTGEFGSRASGILCGKSGAVKISESTLNGQLDFANNSKPATPEWWISSRRTIQLDDFDTGEWSPLTEGNDAAAAAETTKSTATAGETVERVRAVLSPEVMRAIDAMVTLNVGEVLTGKDSLGSGSMTATVRDGRAQVDPLTLDIPGGSVDMGFALEPTEADVGLEARAKIERLNYGILARRIDPASKVGGIISADVDIRTRGATLDDVMDAANGHMDFAIWPDDLKAELFDLWAVNLFVAMMPSLDSKEKSKVNCVVARFNVQDGVMRPAAILIDSTNIQASGDGVIDFKANTEGIYGRPSRQNGHKCSASKRRYGSAAAYRKSRSGWPREPCSAPLSVW